MVATLLTHGHQGFPEENQPLSFLVGFQVGVFQKSDLLGDETSLSFADSAFDVQRDDFEVLPGWTVLDVDPHPVVCFGRGQSPFLGDNLLKSEVPLKNPQIDVELPQNRDCNTTPLLEKSRQKVKGRNLSASC